MQTYDDANPVELAPGVFHLGVMDTRNSWANVPYLITGDGGAALIDPGSAKPEFYSCVLRKVNQVLDPRTITTMIVQHQDPDLCAALPLFEKVVSPEVKIYTPVESLLLVQHYGLSSELHGVEDGESITVGGNRQLSFFMTPYAHFIGSMVTYDHESKSLFTSDAFGGFTVGDNVIADATNPEFLTTFLGQYLGSKRALEYALKRIEQLLAGPGVSRFCPQHGCVIPEDQIPIYMGAAHGLRVGDEIDRLATKNGITLEWSERQQVLQSN
ncbi:MAG: hypothetical protein GY722_15745 [bacterium]|nr:hypothetical protein [bacterium]